MVLCSSTWQHPPAPKPSLAEHANPHTLFTAWCPPPTRTQVYSVGLYVEAEKAAKELGIRYRGGFFEADADYCQAVLDGAFSKVLRVRTSCIW